MLYVLYRSLFVKTIDTTNVWGTGRGMTPGRWLMDLSTLHIPAIRDLAGCTLFVTLPPPPFRRAGLGEGVAVV